MKRNRFLAAACAAMLGAGVFSVAASARDMIPEDELSTYFDEGNHTIGIAGDFNEWGKTPDIIMTDADGDGIFIGVVRSLKSGSYQFKVRADGNWDDSWSEYDPDKDITFNSQINCHFDVNVSADVFVTLDTRGSDSMVWPVNIYSTEEMEPSKYGITGNMLSWGKDEEDAPMYELSKGKYAGVLREVPAGEQEFKVRANSSWDESYGVYEPDYDRTNNSQTNCKTTIPDSGYIIVELDATGADRMLWPVSFAAIDSAGNISDIQYTGKEKATQESSVPTESSAESERSDESSGETSQVSEKSEEESVIEFSAESGGKEEKSESSSKSAGTAAGNTNTGSSTSATVKSDAPSTGETVAAVALLSVLTAALGMIVLSVKKSAE